MAFNGWRHWLNHLARTVQGSRRPSPLGSRGRGAAPRRRPRRLEVEGLEARVVPATFLEIEGNNTTATANVVAVPTGDVVTTPRDGWLQIDASIGGAADLDYFQFTVAAASGVFFDIDSRDIGLSTTLDTVLDVFDTTGTAVTNGSNDDGYDFEGFAAPATSTTDATSPDSSLYLDLAPGTYYVRVGSFSGTAGSYELRLLADTSYTVAAPVLDSLPGAADTLYLDFDGHAANDAWGNYTATAFDLDGDPTQFSPAERLAIQNVWKMVSEDYSPFAINVSTVEPASFNNGEAFRMVITNSDATVVGQPSGILGVAFLNSYAAFGSGDNVAFTFADNFSTFGGGVSGAIMAKSLEIGNTTAHEFGHALDLEHYSTFSGSSGSFNASVLPGAIMATPDLGLSRETWATGINSSDSPQDDMTVISRPFNTFGYRADDHGNTQAAATVLTANGNGYASAGILANGQTDVDYFRFVASGATSIRVGVDSYVTDLNVAIDLYDVSGNLVVTNAPGTWSSATIAQTLAGGVYFLRVRSSSGNSGDAGQYTLSIATTIATTSVSLNAAGDLRIRDEYPGGKADNLFIYADLANSRYVVTDPDNSLFSTVPGTTQPDANTLHIPFASVTGSQIIFETVAGDDSVTIDSSLGKFPLPVFVDAGGDAGDRLAFTGDAANAFATGLVDYEGLQKGTLTYDAAHVVTYQGVNALTLSAPVGALALNMRSTTQAVLEDDANAADGLSLLRSTNGTLTPTTFQGATGAVGIYGSTIAAERVTVNSLDAAFVGGLLIDLRSTISVDEITFAAPLTLTGGGLSATAHTVLQSVGAALNASGGVALHMKTSLHVSEDLIASAGTVSLTTTNGSVTQATGKRIAGTGLTVSATTGVGSAAAPLNVQVNGLEAGTATGGVFITNGAADLAIGGLSAALNGVRVSGSGDILVTTTGNLTLTTAGDTVSGPGAVTLQAGGDLQTGGQMMLDAVLGQTTVTVTAGNDLLLGDGTGQGQVRSAAGSIALFAARDLILNSNGHVEVNSGGGTITAEVGRDITLLVTLANGEPAIRTQGGSITLQGGAGGTFTADSDGATAVASNGGAITVSAADVVLTKALNAGAGTVTLQQATAATARPITFGTNGAGSFGLSVGELGRITAGLLRVGRSDNDGDLQVTATIPAQAGWNSLALRTRGAILDGTAGEQTDLTVASLALRAGTGIGASDNLDVQVTDLAFENSISGAVNVLDFGGGLTVGTVAGLVGATNVAVGGSLRTLNGALTVNAAVVMGGDFTLEAGPSSAAGDDVVLNANVSHIAGGTARLLAGDNVTQNAGVIFALGGTAILSADTEGSAFADGVRGQLVQTGGGLQAGSAALLGDRVAFTAGVNSVGNLAGLATGTGRPFSYADEDDFTVTTVDGVVGVATADGNVTLSSAGGAITLAQPVIAGGPQRRATVTGTALVQTGVGTRVAGAQVTLDASQGAIGSAALPLEIDSGTAGLAANTRNNGNIYLSEASFAPTAVFSAGTGTVHLLDGVYTLLAGDGIDDRSGLHLGGNATLDLGGEDETVAGLGGDVGSRLLLGNNALIAGAGGASTTFDGNLEGAGGGLTKEGAGTLALNGINTATGTLTVRGGTLLANGSFENASTLVASGTTLGGVGTLAGEVLVLDGGTLAPGDGPGNTGTLQAGRLDLNPGATLLLEVNGNGSGAFDQLVVLGTVRAFGQLVVAGSYTPPVGGGDLFVLVNLQGGGAVLGDFSGRPQDSVVDVNGRGFYLRYDFDADGDALNNDVALLGNQPPTAVLPGTYSVTEAGTVVLSSAGSNDFEQPADELSYEWDLDGDSVFGETGADATQGDEVGPSPTFRAAGLEGPGSTTVWLRVTDSANGFTLASTTIAIANSAPTATFGNSGPALEGGSAILTFTDALDLSAADTLAGFLYSYDFDNDDFYEIVHSTSSTAAVPASYLVEGPRTFTMRGRITDKDGGSTVYETTLVVQNSPPTATLNVTGSFVEGEDVSISLTNVSDASAGDTGAGFLFSYDFDNDGTFEIDDGFDAAVTMPGSYVDGQAGTSSIRVRVKDRDGEYTDYVHDYTGTNVAPTAVFSNDPASEGMSTLVSLTNASDPSDADAAAGFLYSYDFDNNGTFDIIDSPNGTVVVPGSYLDDDAQGTHTVGGRIKDKDGLFTDYTTTITISAVAPTADFMDVTVPEGSTASITLISAFDPSTADTAAKFHYAFDFFNDGDFDIGSGNYNNSLITDPSVNLPAEMLANSGNYTVRVRIIDKDEDFTDYLIPVEVLNVAPTADFVNSGPAVEGRPVNFTFFNVFEPSLDDRLVGLRYSYDFDNDGNFEVVDSPNRVESFTFPRPGSHVVRGRVTDQDGDFTEYTTTVRVAPAPLTATGLFASAVAARTFSGTVATIVDGNTLRTAGEFRATILWGDGKSSVGTVRLIAPGRFAVSGRHLYRVGGTYRTTVLISDRGGRFVQAIGKARAADLPIRATRRTLKANYGTISYGVLASFVDTNRLTAASDYRVLINWGDGTSSYGVVRKTAAGQFDVLGSHRYRKVGRFQVKLTIISKGGRLTNVIDPVIFTSIGRRK